MTLSQGILPLLGLHWWKIIKVNKLHNRIYTSQKHFKDLLLPNRL